MKILILGATGMLGYSLFSNLSDYENFDVYGTIRNSNNDFFLNDNYKRNIITNVDISDLIKLNQIISDIKPNIVINCIGIIKQHDISNQYVPVIHINSLLPHQLAELCSLNGSKLIHFSTDCVFDGKKGFYNEADTPNSIDLYGKSKNLGEVNYDGHLTLRTSIIGHELNTSLSLVDWFLDQSISVDGFSGAIFSGFPTCYIAHILANKIIPNSSLCGLYHLSSHPIDKYSLLSKISKVYSKDIIINKNTLFKIDRSLDSKKFRIETIFTPPSWDDLLVYMHNDYLKRYVM